MQTGYSFRKAFAVNATADSFTAKTPTTTKPTGVGVFDLFDITYGVGTHPLLPEFLQLLPFGSDANDEAFDLRVWGWSKTDDRPTPIWVPQMLALLAVTLGNVAATDLGANNFLADTIVVTKGADEESGFGAAVINPANDMPASLMLGLRGCELIEFAVDVGTAASGNCLWRPIHQHR